MPMNLVIVFQALYQSGLKIRISREREVTDHNYLIVILSSESEGRLKFQHHVSTRAGERGVHSTNPNNWKFGRGDLSPILQGAGEPRLNRQRLNVFDRWRGIDNHVSSCLNTMRGARYGLSDLFRGSFLSIVLLAGV